MTAGPSGGRPRSARGGAVTQNAGTGRRGLVVCKLLALPPELPVAALVRGVQLALVRTADDAVYAVGNLDPYSGAHVMARGIVGSTRLDGREVATLVSPIYKQVFDLGTGRALADDRTCLGSWAAWVEGDTVLVGDLLREPAAPGAPSRLGGTAPGGAALTAAVDDG